MGVFFVFLTLVVLPKDFVVARHCVDLWFWRVVYFCYYSCSSTILLCILFGFFV